MPDLQTVFPQGNSPHVTLPRSPDPDEALQYLRSELRQGWLSSLLNARREKSHVWKDAPINSVSTIE